MAWRGPNPFLSLYVSCQDTLLFSMAAINILVGFRNKTTDTTAKTGQSLIASPIFSSLPSGPSSQSQSQGMEVDQSQTQPQSEGGATGTAASAETTAATTQNRKFTPPVDAATGDLLVEGIVYLRLLLILLNLDAGKVEEVSCYSCILCFRELCRGNVVPTCPVSLSTCTIHFEGTRTALLTVQAGQFASETAELVSKANRRTLDQLAAKIYFYLARAYEIQGRLSELQPCVFRVFSWRRL